VAFGDERLYVVNAHTLQQSYMNDFLLRIEHLS
jgi:hypothetical protein